MNYKRITILAAAAALVVAIFTGAILLAASAAPGVSGYKVIKTVPISGEGGWDYVYVDSDARRVYVSHATQVVVLDADSYEVVGSIPDTQGVHGIAIAPELGRGFTSNGRSNDVTIFDLKTLKTIGTVKTDANPDAIVYDSVSKRVFTFNGRGKNTTAINAADGNGGIFVNNEDTSELIQIDSQKITEMHRWPLAPCKSPSGLAMDRKNRRLFSVCDEKVMAVVNADTGKVVAAPTIGEGVDASAFEPATQLAFASNGEGTLTVIHEDSPDKYTVVENVPTKRSARTMGLDLKTHNIFLPAADFDPPAPGERRGKMKPGSFVLLVVGK